MARYKQLTYGALSFQNSFGALEMNSAWPIQIINENLNPDIPRRNITSRYSSFYKRQSVEGPKSTNGNLSFYLDPVTAAVAMKAVFFQHTNASSTNGAYTYKFGVHSVDYNSYFALHPMTVEVNKNETESIYYYDMQATTLNFNLEPGALIAAELGFIGRDYTKTTGSGFVDKGLSKFTTMQISVSIDGVAIKDILNLNFNVDNGITAFHTLQASGTPRKLKRSDVPNIELTGTMFVQNNSMWAAFTENKDKSVMINLADGTSQCKIDLPLMNVVQHTDPNDGVEPFNASFTMEAYYNVGSGTIMEVTVVNSQILAPMWFTLDDAVFGLLDQDYNFLM